MSFEQYMVIHTSHPPKPCHGYCKFSTLWDKEVNNNGH